MSRRISAEIINTLYDIERQLDDLFRKQAKKAGVSYSEFCILYSFSLENSPKTAQHLADEAFMSKQTISSALARMDKKGWICMEPGTDKREKLISLSDSGEAFRRRTTDPMTEIDEHVMARIGFDEIRRGLEAYQKYLDLTAEEYEKLVDRH